jgi:hypothetical protein
VAAGLLGGVLAGAAGTAQAQAPVSTGVITGVGPVPVTGTYPMGGIILAQFPAMGLDPPYYPATIGVPTTPDITVLRGRADATSPLAGQFPMAFMGPVPVR